MMNSQQHHTATAARLAIADASIISVFEHQRLTSHDFVPVSDFTWLLAQEFAVFTIKRQRGQWQLKVGHYIGIILLPSGMTLEILPKPVAEEYASRTGQPRHYRDVLQTRQWVQRMLTELTDSSNNKLPSTKNLGQLSEGLTPLPLAELPLSQWLVAQFLQRLSAYQPTKHYQAQIRNQPSLQGKLLIKEQLKRNSAQPHQFVCETSQLSQDMLSNRLIKSALLLIEPLTHEQSSRTHRSDSQNSQNSHPNQAILFSLALSSWHQIAALSQYERRILESIYIQAKQQLNAQPLRQQQLQSAQQLLDLAYWLLRQSSTDTGSGLSSHTLPVQAVAQPRLCVLIDMNQAFEQWASLRIAAAFSQVNADYQPLYQPQRVWLSDTAGQTCLSIRPDLLIYRPAVHNTTADSQHVYRSGYSHVIDIKWKYLSHSAAISASDAYQLTSYAQAYQAEQVWLVYPVVGSARQPVALTQNVYNDESDGQNYAKLWLMPFNVLTGTLNNWPPQELNIK